MTTENILHLNGEININNLRIELFSADDCTDNNTDKSTSIKLVDQNNNIWMCIETQPLEMYAEETQREIHGCFIRKFEYDERLRNPYYSLIWSDFMHKFMNSVTYVLFSCNDNDYLCRYQYLWAEKASNERCYIANYLRLNATSEFDTIKYYKKDLL